MFRSLVLVGGPTAGVYCARKMLNTIIISENIGGQALASWAIENYMGYLIITGEDSMKKFEEQVRKSQMRLELDRIVSISKKTTFLQYRQFQKILNAKTLILAQGNRPKKLGVANEEQYRTRPSSPVPRVMDLYIRETGGPEVAAILALQTAVEMSGNRTIGTSHCTKQYQGLFVYVRLLESKRTLPFI